MPSHSPRAAQTVGADTAATQEVIDLMSVPALAAPSAGSGAPFDIGSLDAAQVAKFKTRCAQSGISEADGVAILTTYAIGAITGDTDKQREAGERAARLLEAQGQMSPGEDKGVFWSGGEDAKNKGAAAGDSLESKGVAGFLFDGLEFGLGWGKMGALWDAISAHLAKGCKGVVQAHQYRGVRATSVFARVELPVLKKALDNDIVEKIQFQRYWKKKGPDGKPIWADPRGRDPELVKADVFDITSGAEADALPVWDFADESGIANETGLEPDGGTIKLPGF